MSTLISKIKSLRGRTHVLHVVGNRPLTMRPRKDRSLFESERFPMANRSLAGGGGKRVYTPPVLQVCDVKDVSCCNDLGVHNVFCI